MEWSAKSPDVWKVEKYSILNTNSRQETKKKSNNYREKKNPPVWRKLRVADNAGERSRNKANTWFWKLNYALRD